jgi:hypothetical protein
MPNSASDHVHLGLEVILIKLQYTEYYYTHTPILLRSLIVELPSNGLVIYNLRQYYTSRKGTDKNK